MTYVGIFVPGELKPRFIVHNHQEYLLHQMIEVGRIRNGDVRPVVPEEGEHISTTNEIHQEIDEWTEKEW